VSGTSLTSTAIFMGMIHLLQRDEHDTSFNHRFAGDSTSR
jgi:hypothetical protein